MNYALQNDEKLVELYKSTKDQEAFSELFKRYEPLLEEKSKKVSINNGIEYNTIHYKHLHLFWRAVEKYDPAKGASFSTYLFWRLKNAAHTIIKDTKYRQVKDKEGRRLPKEEPAQQEVFECLQEVVDMDSSLVVQEIFEYLRSKGAMYPVVLKMILAGYTYEEIGKALHRPGSPSAVRNWVKRLKQKIAEYVQEYYADSL